MTLLAHSPTTKETHSPFTYLARRLLGSFEQPLLLAVLELKDDAYCAFLTDYLSEILDRRVSVGQVARGLNRLEDTGILSSLRVLPEKRSKGQRSRVVYKLTKQGLSLLDRLEEQEEETDDVVIFAKSAPA